jgi:hypothetical protein
VDRGPVSSATAENDDIGVDFVRLVSDRRGRLAGRDMDRDLVVLCADGTHGGIERAAIVCPPIVREWFVVRVSRDMNDMECGSRRATESERRSNGPIGCGTQIRGDKDGSQSQQAHRWILFDDDTNRTTVRD